MEGGIDVLPSRNSKRNDGSLAYLCPSCGAYRHPGRITNTELVPNAPGDWACDVCWTDWRRKKMEMRDGDDPLTEGEWEHQFFKLSGEDVGHLVPVILRQLDKAKTVAVEKGLNQVDIDKIDARIQQHGN